mmetsp:Transcript_99081/g.171760  ORF Transcript_99081/g.171760 Transcript_99081/m.171760 type:complete len:220 (+) Transcript_99081:41-700(+)
MGVHFLFLRCALLTVLPRMCVSSRETGGDSNGEVVVETKGHGNLIKHHDPNATMSARAPESHGALADPDFHVDMNSTVDNHQESRRKEQRHPEFSRSPQGPPLSLEQGLGSVIMDDFVELQDAPPRSKAATQPSTLDGVTHPSTLARRTVLALLLFCSLCCVASVFYVSLPIISPPCLPKMYRLKQKDETGGVLEPCSFDRAQPRSEDETGVDKYGVQG